MAALSATLLRYITNRAAASTPDAVLLHRFISNRDDDAFAGLVRRHGPLVYRICRRLVGPASADDAFQATFLVLATRAASVRKAESVGSWLVGVAGRVARQMRKSERRREARERAATPVPARAPETDYLEAAEQARILDDELTRLSDRLRGPVVVCLLQGRTYEQAAAELGGSARTIRRRLEQAKRVLRARLERRGIVPAIAAGLVAGLGVADAAVPAGLGTRTVAAVSGFLAGGATIPAALIAKGVATTMTMNVRMIAALVATTAAGLTALGVGLAQDEKPVGPAAPPLPAGVYEAKPNPSIVVQHAPPPPLGGSVPQPSFGVMRAIDSEAQFLRSDVTRRWFGIDARGKGLPLDLFGVFNDGPVSPPPARSIRIMYRVVQQRPPVSSTQLTFEDGLSRAWIDVSGPLDNVIDYQLPEQMTRVTLAERFGAPLPWWAYEGIALTGMPLSQANVDGQCRFALKDGRALRLTALFALTESPLDANTAKAQAHSVVRFLIGPKSPVKPHLAVPVVDGPDPRCAALLDFIRQGKKHGWNQAAYAICGCEVSALEEAWIQWMKSPDSQFLITANPTGPSLPVPAAKLAPSLIPPVKLP